MLGFVIPQTLTTAKQELGNLEVTEKINFFTSFLFGGAIILLVLLLAVSFWKKNDKYGDSFGLLNQGEDPSLKFFKRFTNIQLLFLSILLFSPLLIIGNYLGQEGLTGMIILQQFSKADQIAFSTLLVAISENTFAMACIGMIFIGTTLISLRYKIPKKDFVQYYYILTPIIMGLLAWAWHNTAYVGSEKSIIAVMIFWAFGTLITIAIGNAIPFYVLHILNNFILTLTIFYSSDFMRYVIIGVIVLTAIIYYLLYKDNLFGQGKKKEFIKWKEKI